MINYYAVETALRAHLLAAQVAASVYSVNRLMDVAKLFERVQPSPETADLATAPPYGAVIMFFSGLDSVRPATPGSEACEMSDQEWHLFVTTRYHKDDVERYTARVINGYMVAKVITALKGFDWLGKYYASIGSTERGASVLKRVTADKLLVAEERSIEDPTIVSTLLAYRATFSSNWK